MKRPVRVLKFGDGSEVAVKSDRDTVSVGLFVKGRGFSVVLDRDDATTLLDMLLTEIEAVWPESPTTADA